MKIDTNEYNQRFEYAVEELAEKIAAELTALFAGKYIFYGRYNIFTKRDIHEIYAIDRVEVVPPEMACDEPNTPQVIDYAVMKQAGAVFCGVKCWQGLASDRAFPASWANAKNHLPRFAYCYWDRTVNMAVQFVNFFNLLRDDPGEMPQALDLEVEDTHDKMIAAMRQFEKLYTDRGMRAKYNKNPMLYTNPNMLLNYLKPIPADLLEKYDLFVASYPFIPDTADPIDFIRQSTIQPRTGQFQSWRFWQFSADGNKQGTRFGVESRDIDIDIFNGDETAFREYLGETAPIELTDKQKLDILWAEYKGDLK